MAVKVRVVQCLRVVQEAVMEVDADTFEEAVDLLMEGEVDLPDGDEFIEVNSSVMNEEYHRP